MTLRGLDHYNIQTAKPAETLAFYCDLLGAVDEPGRRPPVGVPGAWLVVGDHPIIHLSYIDEEPPASTGAVHHIAFEAAGYLDLCERLTAQGMDYKTFEAPAMGLLQIFLLDPNQIRVELNFRGEIDAVAAARANASAS